MTDQEKTQAVQDCQTFDELKECFDKIAPVKGSQKEYSAQRLKEKIDQMHSIYFNSEFPFHRMKFNVMTRTHGIRAKVMELYWYQKNGI